MKIKGILSSGSLVCDEKNWKKLNKFFNGEINPGDSLWSRYGGSVIVTINKNKVVIEKQRGKK